jgi:hypothetical protein
MKINLSSHGASRKKSWVTELQRQFAVEHDIKPGHQLCAYIATPGGARAFTEWLQHQGYETSFWCIEPHVTYDSYGRKQMDHIGFGVEFNDRCPKLTELRLKV